MAIPKSIDARRFYRVALQRLEDADILLRNKRLGAAVYLAGYAVECMLKALVLENSPTSRQSEILVRFRGARGHSIESLRQQYAECGGPPWPKDVAAALIIVNRWGVELRYEPKAPALKLVKRFLVAAKLSCQCADRRF